LTLRSEFESGSLSHPGGNHHFLGNMQPAMEQMQSLQSLKSSQTSSDWYLRMFGSPPIPEDTGIYKLHLQAQATLGTAIVRESVKKPIGIELQVWVAAQTVGIYQEVCYLCALMEDLCTEECCPRMSAGKHNHYAWQDRPGDEVLNCTAYTYQIKLLEYSHRVLRDRDLIPQDGRPFPPHFMDEMKVLLKRWFRIYAHIYLHHFKVFLDGGAEAHLNCTYKRFLFFVKEFQLVDDKDMQPLKELNDKFLAAHAAEKAERELKKAQKAQQVLGDKGVLQTCSESKPCERDIAKEATQKKRAEERENVERRRSDGGGYKTEM